MQCDLVCDVVDNDDAMCTTVIAGRYCTEPLLACCVPLQQKNSEQV